jgi:anti-anti-sigma factor
VDQVATEFFLDGSTCPRRLVVSGDLDLLNSPQLLERLGWLSMTGRPTHLDLTGVGFIDASAVGMLVRASRAAGGDGVRIVAASDVVRRVFHLCDAGWLLDPPGTPPPAGVASAPGGPVAGSPLHVAPSPVRPPRRRVGTTRRGAEPGPAATSSRPCPVEPIA